MVQTATEAAPTRAAGMLDGEALLREVVARLVAGLAPQRIVLFGSRARGEAHAQSDFDLLVVADVPGTLPERMTASRRLLDGLGLAADIVVFTPDEVERYRAWPGHIVRTALRDGVVLHDAG